MRITAVIVAITLLLQRAPDCDGLFAARRSAPTLRPAPRSLQRRPHFVKSQRHCAGYIQSLQLFPAYSDAGEEDTKSPQRKRDFIRRQWNDFKFGISHVHNNYLSLLLMVYSRALLTVFTVWLLTGVLMYISLPALNWTVRFLLNSLIILSRIPEVFLLPLVFPFLVAIIFPPILVAVVLNKIPARATQRAAGAIGGFLQSFVLAPLWRWATQSATPLSMIVSISQRTALANFVRIVGVAPIVEESLYRYYFNRLRDVLMRFRSSKPEDTKKNRRRWTAIGSFIFGCAHINNWLTPEMDVQTLVATNMHGAILFISLTILQFTASFVLSQGMLFPIFEQNGLMASIGAHATWNGLVFTSAYHFLPRLVARLWRRLKRKGGDARI